MARRDPVLSSLMQSVASPPGGLYTTRTVWYDGRMTTNDVRYPGMRVKASANAYHLLGGVQRELNRAGRGDEVAEYHDEAIGDGYDYERILAATKRWVTVYDA